jgi:hypothetical protein
MLGSHENKKIRTLYRRRRNDAQSEKNTALNDVMNKLLRSGVSFDFDPASLKPSERTDSTSQLVCL